MATYNEPDLKPVIGRVSYTIRLKIAEYSHEEMVCELGIEGANTPEALMARCRKICIENSTQHKKDLALKEKKPDGI